MATRKRHQRHHARHKKRWTRSWWFRLLCLVGIAALIDLGLLIYQFEGDRLAALRIAPPAVEGIATPRPTVPSASARPTPVVLPDQVHLSVPFQVQAPFANWDALHEDACEEASLLMVNHFRSGTPIASQEAADEELKAFVGYQEERGYGLSITLAQLREAGAGFYGLSSGRIVTNATMADLKREVAAGRPVIVPAAGKLLGNPHFSNGGPNYHMLVLIGYDADGFITNDPGIREGKDYRYSYDVLYNAIHDWNPSDILQGEKAYLVYD